MVTLVTIFRLIAFLEGVSYILLLFIATPIKYLMNNPAYVKILGMPHGILFILYLVIAFMLRSEASWSKKAFTQILLASLVPFGTFYIDRKYLK